MFPVIIILAAVIGGGLYFSGRGDDAMMEKESDVMMQEEVTMEKPADTMMDPSMGSGQEGAMYQGQVLAGTKAQLLDFVKVDYEKALASDKLIVLYFYADWCPVCQAEFPKMISAFNKLTSDEVVGFRVNYKDDFTDEDEVALAKQFGIAYQHTKVFVKNGAQVLKSPEGWDEARYISEIEKALQ